MNSKDLIKHARKLCEEAAPGPWKYRDNGVDGGIYDADEFIVVGGEPCEGRIEPDDKSAKLIAESRTLVPQLCDALEMLAARAEKAEAYVEAFLDEEETEMLPDPFREGK